MLRAHRARWGLAVQPERSGRRRVRRWIGGGAWGWRGELRLADCYSEEADNRNAFEARKGRCRRWEGSEEVYLLISQKERSSAAASPALVKRSQWDAAESARGARRAGRMLVLVLCFARAEGQLGNNTFLVGGVAMRGYGGGREFELCTAARYTSYNLLARFTAAMMSFGGRTRHSFARASVG